MASILTLTAAVAFAIPPAPPAAAQPPTATAVAPSPTPGPPPTPAPPPPPDIAGRWSITRTWYRSCPRCGRVASLTTPWTITQAGNEVRVDRGPRGGIVDDGAGGGYLALDGLEQAATSTLRFWYATLRVSADGNAFEGAFNGSESANNPCGDRPPQVTCFASAGWIRGQRIDPVATIPPPPGPPTPEPPTSMPTATATDIPSPTATAIPTVASTATATTAPSSTPTTPPSATPTARPDEGRCWLPAVGNEG